MGVMRIDFDDFNNKKLDTLQMMYGVPIPYKIRLSASREGLHLIKQCNCKNGNDCYRCWLYIQYDDWNRLKCNIERRKAGLAHNVVWDSKHGKNSDEWYNCNDHTDIMRFCSLYME